MLKLTQTAYSTVTKPIKPVWGLGYERPTFWGFMGRPLSRGRMNLCRCHYCLYYANICSQVSTYMYTRGPRALTPTEGHDPVHLASHLTLAPHPPRRA